MALIELTHGQVTIVDDEDLRALSNFRWYAIRSDQSDEKWYAATTDSMDRKIVYMHRMIMAAPKGICVDHIDRNPLNNRRANLRLATRSQNNANADMRRSGSNRYTGAYWRKDRHVWAARISVNGEFKYIGQFQTELEAALAYDEAARHYFGEFAMLNFPERAA